MDNIINYKKNVPVMRIENLPCMSMCAWERQFQLTPLDCEWEEKENNDN
jgi:hypothetical protein